MAFLKRATSFKKTNFMLNDGMKHQVYTVSPKGDTVFRIFPAPAAQPGQFQPQIVPMLDDVVAGLSDSFCEVEVADWLGKDKISLVTTIADPCPDGGSSPAKMFFYAIKDFCKDETNKAKAGKPFNQQALAVWDAWYSPKGIASAPQTRMLLQGVLINHAGEPCKNKQGAAMPKVPIVLSLGRSATIDMEGKLITKVTDNEDISAANSLMGDITDIQAGASISVKKTLNKDQQVRYIVDKAGVTPLDPNMVLSHFVAWEDLLSIKTAAEQINILVEQFCPEAVDLAFRGDSYYGPMLPQGVAGSYAAKYENVATQQPAATVVATAAQPAVATQATQQAATIVTTAAQPAAAAVVVQQAATVATQPAAAAVVLTAEIVDEAEEVPADLQPAVEAQDPAAAAMVKALEMAKVAQGA